MVAHYKENFADPPIYIFTRPSVRPMVIQTVAHRAITATFLPTRFVFFLSDSPHEYYTGKIIFRYLTDDYFQIFN